MSELEPFGSNTWFIVVEVLDTDGEPLDLNEYDQCWFSVREKRDYDKDEPYGYLIDPVEGAFEEPQEDGLLSFTLPYTLTGVTRGDYFYGVLLKKDGDPDEYYTIAKDRCRIKAPITEPQDVGGA